MASRTDVIPKNNTTKAVAWRVVKRIHKAISILNFVSRNPRLQRKRRSTQRLTSHKKRKTENGDPWGPPRRYLDAPPVGNIPPSPNMLDLNFSTNGVGENFDVVIELCLFIVFTMNWTGFGSRFGLRYQANPDCD